MLSTGPEEYAVLASRSGLPVDLQELPSSFDSLQALVVQVMAAAAHLALVHVLLHHAYLPADGADSLSHTALRAVPAWISVEIVRHLTIRCWHATSLKIIPNQAKSLGCSSVNQFLSI